MASKHDAKRAMENIWVMQQNMARQKGGTRFTPKAPPPRVKPVPAAAKRAATEAATAADAKATATAPEATAADAGGAVTPESSSKPAS